MCSYCSLKFDTKSKYVYHLQSHNPDKKFKCKFCDKSFLQHHHLTDHEQTHTGYRPYLCDICAQGKLSSFSFVSNSNICIIVS